MLVIPLLNTYSPDCGYFGEDTFVGLLQQLEHYQQSTLLLLTSSHNNYSEELLTMLNEIATKNAAFHFEFLPTNECTIPTIHKLVDKVLQQEQEQHQDYNTDMDIRLLNATNNRFAQNGNFLNQQIHTIFNEMADMATSAPSSSNVKTLQVECLNRFGHRPKVGDCFLFPVPPQNPLSKQWRITTVLMAMFPTLNTQRNGFVKDPTDALRLLSLCYATMLSTTNVKEVIVIHDNDNDNDNDGKKMEDLGEMKRARSCDDIIIQETGAPSQCLNDILFNPPSAATIMQQQQQQRQQGFDRSVLERYVTAPQHYPQFVFMESSDVVVVYDLYPKARIHLLMIPKSHFLLAAATSTTATSSLRTPPQVTSCREFNSPVHERQLRQMLELAMQITSCPSVNPGGGVEFMVGFHAIPSLLPLHLHILSNDLVSDFVKNKKHYNSFATQFFVPLVDIIEQLRRNQSMQTKMPSPTQLQQLLSSPLQCHRCKKPFAQLPQLKTHLLSQHS